MLAVTGASGQVGGGLAVSDTVPRLTGHPAQSLADYLEKHPESYRHLPKSA